MKALRFILSVMYAICQIALGLFLHPYQTMQSLVQQKVFVWMVLLPSITVGFITLFWRFLAVPTLQQVISCSALEPIGCGWIAFISNTLTFFGLYWQVLLLYLLLRFHLAYSSK